MAINAGEAISETAAAAQESLLETYEAAQSKLLAAKVTIEAKFESMTSPHSIEMTTIHPAANDSTAVDESNIAWPSLTDKAYFNPPLAPFM
jgi:hypothetical protein